MVRVAGVEPAWTCAQDMWVGATLHRDLKKGSSAFSCLALHAHDLAQRVYHVHQIALRFHDGINGLVPHRSFIDDIRVLTTFDAGSRLSVVVQREPALRFRTGHGTSGSMTTAHEALRVALAAH